MDTLKIKAFLLAVKYKSLSKAAEEFSYTPSAFSHIMDALEADLGLKLLKRTHQGVEITEAGQLLTNKFQAFLDSEKSIYDTVTTIREFQENTLRIGTYHSVAMHLLPEVLNGFKNKYPHIKTSILVSDRFSNWLQNDQADVIFSDIGPVTGTKWYPLMEDTYVAVVSDSLFTGRKMVRREELYDYPFIHTNEGKLRQYFDFHKFKDIIHLTSVEDTSVLSLARENIGVAVLPQLSVRKKTKDIRILRLEPKTKRVLGISCNDTHSNKAAECFVQYVNELYSDTKTLSKA